MSCSAQVPDQAGAPHLGDDHIMAQRGGHQRHVIALRRCLIRVERPTLVMTTSWRRGGDTSGRSLPWPLLSRATRCARAPPPSLRTHPESAQLQHLHCAPGVPTSSGNFVWEPSLIACVTPHGSCSSYTVWAVYKP